jgi:GntR family transcriptional repressor for pyruvate dehydrogenase complex
VATSFQAIAKQSVSDAVFQQLRDRILSGELVAGERLPAERVLCEALGVNRSAVREALKRLEQARLVSVRHGGSSKVLDYRSAAGLDLLPDLLVTASGGIDVEVVRSVVEMRSAIAPDIARLAAVRGEPGLASRLDAIVAAMSAEDVRLDRLQDLAAEFWSELVAGSGNIAYRLAYNSLHETYDRSRAALAEPLRDELSATRCYGRLADAVRSRNEEAAFASARDLVTRGETGLVAALKILENTRGEVPFS